MANEHHKHPDPGRNPDRERDAMAQREGNLGNERNRNSDRDRLDRENIRNRAERDRMKDSGGRIPE